MERLQKELAVLCLSVYVLTRLGLRLIVGKTRRNALIQTVWPASRALPTPVTDHMPAGVRRWWATHTLTGEPAVTTYLRKTHGGLFVDVGANLGFYGITLQRNFQRTIAIEADPKIYKQLKENLPKNGTALNFAVSNAERNVVFYAADGAMIGSTIHPNDQTWNTGHHKVNEIVLPAAPLSRILAGEENIDVVKVDVEGAEWQVIEGAGDIMPKIKQWIIELHQLSRKSELEARMKAFGYVSCQWVDKHHAVFRRRAEFTGLRSEPNGESVRPLTGRRKAPTRRAKQRII